MMVRHWLFRVSIGANAFVLFYFMLYSSSTTFSPTTTPMDLNISPKVQSQKLVENTVFSLEGSHPLQEPSKERSSQIPLSKAPELQPPPLQKDPEPRISQPHQQSEDIQQTDTQKNTALSQDNNELEDNGGNAETKGDGSLKETPASREVAHMDFETDDGNIDQKIIPSRNNDVKRSEDQLLYSERVKSFPCDDSTPITRFAQRGPFWVLYNYIKPRKHFKCDESITYTTHADFTFLDNLIPLLERWKGPISLSLYSPGTDFMDTLNRINYLRECVNGSGLVRDYVNFHLFFDYKHTPKVKIPYNPTSNPVNCSAFTPNSVQFGENLPTYKKNKKLPYPVNVARNVAREMSTTHYILPSDIELYPNPNLIPDFLDMIKRNDTPELQRPNPNKLFVLSIFEVEANIIGLPQDKTELVYMLKNKSAIPFHKYVCATCHRIPKAKEWIAAPVTPGLKIFHVGKRYKPYHHWEPIFIGTKLDPFYDERLTWEGRSDKMTQGYVLCVLDYEFHILDNAFLVHRPGIKKTVTIPSKNPVVAKQNAVIAKIILPELKQLYGSKSGCYV